MWIQVLNRISKGRAERFSPANNGFISPVIEIFLRHDPCMSFINSTKTLSVLMGPRGFFAILSIIGGKVKMKGVPNLDRQEIFKLITEERDRQDIIHPIIKRKYEDKNVELIANLIDQTDFLTVAVEEIGEVARAMQGEGDLKEELVQLASVIVRWLEQFK